MLESDDPTVRQDAEAIRRVAFDDDPMVWVYLLFRMSGYGRDADTDRRDVGAL
jgi:hypothetical protein